MDSVSSVQEGCSRVMKLLRLIEGLREISDHPIISRACGFSGGTDHGQI
jgi:hypothetical protein